MGWWDNPTFQEEEEKKRKKEAEAADKKWFEAPSYGQDFSWAGGYSYRTPDPEPEPEPPWTKPEPEPTYVIDDPWMQQFDIPTPPVSVKTDAEWEQEWWTNWKENNPSAPVDTSYDESEDEGTDDGYDPAVTEMFNQPVDATVPDDPYLKSLTELAGQDALAAKQAAEAQARMDTHSLLNHDYTEAYELEADFNPMGFGGILSSLNGEPYIAGGTITTDEAKQLQMYGNLYGGIPHTDTLVYDFSESGAGPAFGNKDTYGNTYYPVTANENPTIKWEGGHVTAAHNFDEAFGLDHQLWMFDMAEDLGVAEAEGWEDFNEMFAAYSGYASFDDYKEMKFAYPYDSLNAAEAEAYRKNQWLADVNFKIRVLESRLIAGYLDNVGMSVDDLSNINNDANFAGIDGAEGWFTEANWELLQGQLSEQEAEKAAAEVATFPEGTNTEGIAVNINGVDDNGNANEPPTPDSTYGDMNLNFLYDIDEEGNRTVRSEYRVPDTSPDGMMSEKYADNVGFTFTPLLDSLVDDTYTGDPEERRWAAPQNTVSVIWRPFLEDKNDKQITINATGDVELEGFIDRIGAQAQMTTEELEALKTSSTLQAAAETVAATYINYRKQTSGIDNQVMFLNFFTGQFEGHQSHLDAHDPDATGEETDDTIGEDPIDTDTVEPDAATGGALDYRVADNLGAGGDYTYQGGETVFDPYRQYHTYVLGEDYGNGHGMYAGPPADLLADGIAADGTRFIDELFSEEADVSGFLLQAGIDPNVVSSIPWDDYVAWAGANEEAAGQLQTAAELWAQERNAYGLGVVPERTVQDSAGNDVKQYWSRSREWKTQEQIIWELGKAGVSVSQILSPAMMMQLYNNADPAHGGDYLVHHGWLPGGTTESSSPEPPPPEAPPEYDSIADEAQFWDTDPSNFYDQIKDLPGSPVNQLNSIYRAIMPFLTYEDGDRIYDLLTLNGVTDIGADELPDDTAEFHNAADFMTKGRFEGILNALDGLDTSGWIESQTLVWLREWVNTLMEFTPDPEEGENWLSSEDRSRLINALAEQWQIAQGDNRLYGGVTGIASKLALPYQSAGYWALYFGAQQPNPQFG